MQILGNIVMIFLGAIIIGTAFNGLINAYNKTHPQVEQMYCTNSDKSKNTKMYLNGTLEFEQAEMEINMDYSGETIKLSVLKPKE